MVDVAQSVPSLSTAPDSAAESELPIEMATSTLQASTSSSAVMQTQDAPTTAPQTAISSSTAEQVSTPTSPSTPTEWGSASDIFGFDFLVLVIDHKPVNLPSTSHYQLFDVDLLALDSKSGSQFYACPSTGETTWDAPVGHFVLPPSTDGEWWELHDETRGGISYYYHTVTGETTWDKPDGFVIPLGVVQNTALGRKLSQSTRRHSHLFAAQPQSQSQYQSHSHSQSSSSSHSHSHNPSPSSYKTRRSQRHLNGHGHGPPSVISERTEEVTEDTGFSSGLEGGRTDRERERVSRSTKPHTPTRPPSAASTSSHHNRPQPSPSPSSHSLHSSSPSPSRPRTKSQPNSGLASGSSSGQAKQQSLTAVAEYIAYGDDERRNKDRTRSSPSRKSNPNGSDITFTPTASSSPVRRPASASGKTSASKQPPPLPSTSSLSIVPDFSKLRKASSAAGVGPGVGTTIALMHAGVQVNSGLGSRAGMRVHSDGTSSPRQGTFPLPGGRPPPSQLQPRHFSSSTPPSSVTNPSTNSGFGSKGKRDRRNTGLTAAVGNGLVIGHPVLDIEKTLAMSPMRLADTGAPIHVHLHSPLTPTFPYPGGVSSSESDRDGLSPTPGSPVLGHPETNVATKRLSTGPHPLLPRELVSDIQRFAQSDFARKYFATHREGILFRRRVPLEKMMSWQKAPLTQPLLSTPKLLHKDATKAFKAIQRVMGDRDRDRSLSTATNGSSHPTSPHDSSSSLHHLQTSTAALLEEERTLLSEGLAKGEMRDEIYCQLVKQLSKNPSPESTFRGWQLLCVLLVTFPPSKDFEPYVRGFIESHTNGDLPAGGSGSSSTRIDLMARHCLIRLETISKRGPKGKAPSLLEIEIASDAAFNPSTFGEPLGRIYKLQQRNYAALKIPIILPFLTDGILALGGTKAEGIFRLSGDGDLVSELRLRIDRGVYTLDGIDDPHVLASLLKLWIRELREPLFPSEMYNSCVACSSDPERCVEMVKSLPTLNRRVVLFIISFLQLFLDDRIYRATKMSAEALSLVIAPNLMRCVSDEVGVVVTNARFEQQFICNLLLHLRCDQIDSDFIPEHGRGATPSRKSSNHGHGHGHNKMQASESSSGSGTRKTPRRKEDK